MESHEVIGQGPGLGCHSGPAQPDCDVLFETFGLSRETGDAATTADAVFKLLP